MGRENLKRILLIATGGTIASGYTEKGLAPKIAAEDFTAICRGVSGFLSGGCQNESF